MTDDTFYQCSQCQMMVARAAQAVHDELKHKKRIKALQHTHKAEAVNREGCPDCFKQVHTCLVNR